ncbi:MAG: alpha/beta hydrolase [Deltaproteobacteria bacterium]|nr:alpha/beta hydrolase [Deltaproteobacteria bacterium]
MVSAAQADTKKAGDINMEYRTLGKGYPLIMITGFSGTMDLWASDALDILSSHYKVIIFDNRGMGGTSAGNRKFTIEQFADDTAGLMEALGIDRAHVLGWSMGTEIAQELTLRHPEKVTRLVLYAADCSMKACPPAPDILKKMSDTSGTPEEQGKRLIGLLFPQSWIKNHVDDIKKLFSGQMRDSSPENIERQGIAMDSWKGSCDRLSQIKCPTLLITGTDDILTPPQNSYMMVDKIPGAKLVTLENGGHGVMYQYPEKFCDAIIDFLK